MSVERVRNYLKQFNVDNRIKEFNESSATVELAAERLGVVGARICKTISFYGEDDTCILIEAAGDTKIDNQKFKAFFGFKAKMLSPDDVTRFTGYHIGGVCAFDINDPKVKIYCDNSLKRFETVFPACGSDKSAIELTIDELFKYSKAIDFIDVTKLIEE